MRYRDTDYRFTVVQFYYLLFFKNGYGEGGGPRHPTKRGPENECGSAAESGSVNKFYSMAECGSVDKYGSFFNWYLLNEYGSVDEYDSFYYFNLFGEVNSFNKSGSMAECGSFY